MAECKESAVICFVNIQAFLSSVRIMIILIVYQTFPLDKDVISGLFPNLSCHQSINKTG